MAHLQEPEHDVERRLHLGGPLAPRLGGREGGEEAEHHDAQRVGRQPPVRLGPEDRHPRVLLALVQAPRLGRGKTGQRTRGFDTASERNDDGSQGDGRLK